MGDIAFEMRIPVESQKKKFASTVCSIEGEIDTFQKEISLRIAELGLLIAQDKTYIEANMNAIRAEYDDLIRARDTMKNAQRAIEKVHRQLKTTLWKG